MTPERWRRASQGSRRSPPWRRMRSPRRDVGTLARTASRSEAWVATRMGPGAPNASGPSSRVTNVTDDPAVVAMRPNAEPTRPLPTTVNDGGGGRGGRLGVVGSRRGGGSRRRRRATRWRRAGGERRRTRRRCHLRRARDTTPSEDEPATFALREGRRARRVFARGVHTRGGCLPAKLSAPSSSTNDRSCR